MDSKEIYILCVDSLRWSLRLLDTYAAKSCRNQTPLHISLNNSAARQIFETWSRSGVIEGNVQEGCDFAA